MQKVVLLVLTLFLIYPAENSAAQLYSKELPENRFLKDDALFDPSTKKYVPLYRYQYIERQHTLGENLKNIGIVYGLSWFFYPLLQPKVFKVEDGFNKYKRNFGRIVFDKDEPIWNFFVHPISGSQLYLLYRADGYSRMQSVGMATISSTLFELTVETLTEPASVQDLYQTPILGSILGLGIETLSLSLLNTGTTLGKITGHLINPATLLPFYEGRTLIIPKLEDGDRGAMMRMEVRF